MAAEQPDPTSALDALSAGGDAIAESVLGDPPVVLETAGWILLAFVALLFWRVIAKRSFRELPGPVTLALHSGASRNATEAEIKIADAAQRAAFRVAVLRNVSEPGALPGAAAIQSLTDLLEVPGLDSWFAPVARALKTILAIPRGFNVTAEVVPPDKFGGQWIALVRVSDLDSGKDVAVSTQTGTSDMDACRSAGYWAAAVVLSRSSRIPSWASWDSQTSTALALYDEPHLCTTSRIAKALAKAPSSGVLLQKLAAAYDVDGRLLDSISMSARAVAAHPRYHVAEYRLASGINMLADRADLWLAAPLAERSRIIGQIDRAVVAVRAKSASTESLRNATVARADGAIPLPDELEAPFRELAKAMFTRYRRDLGLLRILGRSLRRGERDIWLPGQIVGRVSIRVLSRWTVRSALLICESGGRGCSVKGAPKPKDLDRVKRRASKPSSHFQLSYNLACYSSRLGDVNGALTWLETSLERAHSWQITDRWLEKDPDLARVRGSARYDWVVRQVRGAEHEGDSDAHEIEASGVRRIGDGGERRRSVLAGQGR